MRAACRTSEIRGVTATSNASAPKMATTADTDDREAARLVAALRDVASGGGFGV